MLTVSVLMVLGFSVQQPGLTWADATEVKEQGVTTAATGEYDFWVWALEDAPVQVRFAGRDWTGCAERKDRDKPPRYVWLKLGRPTLSAGKHDIALPPSVASVALSADPAFDPAKVQPDIRVFDQPECVEDRRVSLVRDTNTVFTMPAFDSRKEWEAYAAILRRRILLSSGLCPLPERTPLNAKIFDPVEREDYIVEKVHFEARPGFLVTGNLYRPKGKGPYPAVLNPHGHWQNGRLENTDTCSVPGRCITFARMGMVAFTYDMIGRTDSRQFPHGWGGEREKLWGIHPFAMQLWSSMRALDFLESLPYVDRKRLACTGASGGGTQTFTLMAVDPRVKVASPNVMISCNMQGGCQCENAPILRLNNSNMEIGALMAPRPLLLVSATGDWTWETPRVEYPAISSIYRLYGKEDRIENVHIDAGHNYNHSSREAVYRFFGKWLLKQPKNWTDFREPEFRVEPESALRVLPGDQTPRGYPNSEQIIAATIESSRQKWLSILPRNANDFPEFKENYGTTLREVLGVECPAGNEVAAQRVGVERREGLLLERLVVTRPEIGDEIPALLYRPNDAQRRDTVLVVHGDGKAALADCAKGGPGPLIQQLLSSGKSVMTIDAFLLGEHHSPQARTTRKTGRFPDTFLPTDTGYRVQDVLTALAYLRSRRDLFGTVDLVGLANGGMWCLLAGAVDGKVRRLTVDANRFPVNDDEAWVTKYYVPCIRSIGDITTASYLLAPTPLWVINAGEPFDVSGLRNAYPLAQTDSLRVTDAPAAMDELAAWLD